MANVFDKIVADKHVVAESSLLKATEVGHIYSLEMIEDTDNGTIVARGAWVEDQVFKAKAYVAGTDAPLLVLTPPMGYNSDRRSYQDEQYFYNAKGEIARAYELCVGDIFTISKDAFSGTPEVGKYVDATYTVAESAGSTGFVGEIIDKVSYTNSESYRIFVAKV